MTTVKKVDGVTDGAGGALSTTSGPITAGGRITDGFLGTNGDSIVGRTPDTNNNGATWTKYGGSAIEIQTNQLRFNAAWNGALIDFGQTDQDVTVTWNPGAANNDFIVNLRSDLSTDNRYYIHVNVTADQLRVVKVVSAVQTQLQSKSYTFAQSTTYTIRARVEGTAIKVAVCGVEEFSFTDSSITTGNNAGIEHGAFVSNLGRADNFDLQDPAAITWDAIVTAAKAKAKAKGAGGWWFQWEQKKQRYSELAEEDERKRKKREEEKQAEREERERKKAEALALKERQERLERRERKKQERANAEEALRLQKIRGMY